MPSIINFFRLLRINFIMARYGIDRVVFSSAFLANLRFLSYLNPWNWLNHYQGKSRAECLRLAIEELGPIFVKFGQALSTRLDLLPDDIAKELAKLQDKVPPFPGKIAKQMIEKTYGQPIAKLFAEFDLEPLASASIAQVHTATLWNGKAVVVKILRPGIKKMIRRDISLLYTIARLIEHFWSQGWRLHPREVIKEFEKVIFDELDLTREAANASQLHRNFLNSELLYVPEVYWEYARHNIAVFERIYGTPISHLDFLRQEKVDLKKLADRGVEIFFTQVFRDNFFHADMHPGNVLVDHSDPINPRYIAVDFGIMGSLSSEDQRYIADNLLAFFNRDYKKVALLHVQSGWVPAYIRIEEFEATIRTVCEPIFEKPLKDISFGQLLVKLFQTARRFHMEVQPQLLLLQKTLLNIEGLGRQLCPDLDLWETAKPFLEDWIKQQIGPQAFFKKIYNQAPIWMERLIEMPDLLYEHLKAAKQKSIKPNSSTLPPKKTNMRFGFGLALLLTTAINLSLLHHMDYFVYTNIAMALLGGALTLLGRYKA